MDYQYQLRAVILIAVIAATSSCDQRSHDAASSPSSPSATPAETASSGYEFKAGFPTEATVRRIQDERDYQRAIQAYHFFYPTVSMEGTFTPYLGGVFN